MLDILKCMDDRNGLMLTGNKDELAELMFSDEPEDCIFISAMNYFDKSSNLKVVPDSYNLRCVFELGKIYGNTSLKLALFWFTKAQVKSCLFSALKVVDVFDKNIKRSKDTICAIQPERFSEDYLNYLKACEVFATGNFPSKASKLGAFYSVPTNELETGKFMPSFYLPEFRKIRKELSKADTLPLQDVADIFKPNKIKDGPKNVLLLKPSNVRFPVSLAGLTRGDATSVLLHPGDIVICTIGDDNRAIIFDRDEQEPVYAAQTTAVIRPKNISPEYLCFYLSSDVTKAVLSAYSQGIVFKQLPKKVLSEFPIIKPKMNEEYYRAEYAVLSGRAERDYVDLNSLCTVEPEPVEAILDQEIALRISAYYEDQLRSFLTSDIEELNTCFAHGAYKAAIILAGSILEAVLIDWLSEIKHKNFFIETYRVYDKRTDKYKRADLYDYINEIKYIDPHVWHKEDKLAHVIREKRNLIHARLCIDKDEVNEGTARMVIDYLEQVLKTRGIYSA